MSRATAPARAAAVAVVLASLDRVKALDFANRHASLSTSSNQDGLAKPVEWMRQAFVPGDSASPGGGGGAACPS